MMAEKQQSDEMTNKKISNLLAKKISIPAAYHESHGDGAKSELNSQQNASAAKNLF